MADIAALEGWPAEDYAISLSNAIRFRGVKLSDQRERLAALAQVGAGADMAAADTLAQHIVLLEALFTRFAGDSFMWAEKALVGGGGGAGAGAGAAKSAEVAERYLAVAIKAQVAAVRALSALKILRDAPSPQPPTTCAAVDAPAALLEPGLQDLAISGQAD